jgi:hypothetical protein
MRRKKMGSQLIETLQRTLKELERAAKSAGVESHITDLRWKFEYAIIQLKWLQAAQRSTSADFRGPEAA